MDNGSKVKKSITWQGFNKACSFGMNFLIQIVLARLIAPEDFGNLAILNAIIGFANIFVESGVSTALVQKKELDDQDIFTAQFISLLIAVIICGVLIMISQPIAAYYDAPSLALPLRAISIVLIFSSVNAVFSSLLIRKMEFKKLFFRTVSVLPISGAIGIFLAYKGLGLWALVIYQLFSNALNSLVFVFLSNIKIQCKLSLKKAKEIYSFGVKILLSSIVNSIYDTIRVLIIGGKYSKSDLAYYDRSNTYARYSVQIVNSTITSVALPLFSRRQESLENLKNSARRIVQFTAFVMFPILVGLASISKPLILLLLTDKWGACIPFFSIFCFLRIPGIITGIDMQMFYAIGRSDIALKYSILAFVVNVVSLYFAVPYGVMAIAINTLLVEITVSIVLMITSAKVMKYTIYEKIEDLRKPFIGCVCLFLVESLITNCIEIENMIIQLIVQLLFGIATYLTMAALQKDRNMEVIKRIIVNKIIQRRQTK